MRTAVVRAVLAAAVLSAGAVFPAGVAKNFTPMLGGYASFEAGEVVKGHAKTGEIKRVWLQTGYLGIRTEADVSDRLRILVGGETQHVFSFRRSEGAGINEYLSARVPKTVFLFKHGEAIYSIGNGDFPLLQLEAGFFPYKYNSGVRNLGEYLFRTYCYPAAMLNMFDRPYADLVGFRVGNSFAAGPGHFHHDLILHTSMTNNLMDFWPYMDWSLSYLADYSTARLFGIGAGVQLWDLISVGAANSQVGNPKSPDPSLMGGREVTFAGTKLMARFSLDVKGFFPEGASFIGMLGNNDLTLYGEAAVLGVENYPDTTSDTLRNQGYHSRRWRLPVMLGVNLPVFKVLDVLNFELEYLDSPYPNSYSNVYYDFLPLPAHRTAHSKFKWSVYAKRSIGPHVSIIFQAARDHLIPFTAPNSNEFADKTDILLLNDDWWWAGKVRFDL
ncbi:MAG: hypothetical protein JXA18_15130 [Chitinispirillaceae bacterium]|nr:hypothetical protein [Chitinispirillaceae bacterium]